MTNRELFATKGDVPVLSNSSENNGISGYVNLPATEQGNKITFSDTTTSDAIFYQPRPFVGYPHVQGLYAKQNGVWNEKNLLYFLSLFKAAAFGRFDYAAKFTRVIAMSMEVLLPVRGDGQIDFPYMEAYIRELEAARIRELEKYLIAAGFDDCKLTKDEQRTIEDWKQYKFTTKQFKLEDLFVSCTGNTDIQQKDIGNEGNIVVSSGIANCGIIGKTLRETKIISNPCITVDMFGNVFTRDFPFAMVTHARIFAIIPKEQKLSQKTLLYVSTLIKYFSLIYSFSSMASWNAVKNVKISLPVDESGEIDYRHIETFIRAIMKLAIRGVIELKDKEIAATKSVV